eukprot:ANDGO_04635.mRNA.1 hypothetical protein
MKTSLLALSMWAFLAFAAASGSLCYPSAPDSAVHITATLELPGMKFGEAVTLDEYQSKMYISVAEPNPGIARIDTRGDMSLESYIALPTVYGPPVSLGYSPSRGKLYAVVSNGSLSDTVQAHFLQINAETLLVEDGFSLNVTMTANDMRFGGTEIIGYPILFDEVAACQCSMNAFFSFRHHVMQGELTHSVAVDLHTLSGTTVNTFTDFGVRDQGIFDIARIPGTFEALYTHGFWVFFTETNKADVDRVNLLNFSTAARVFTFNDTFAGPDGSSPLQTDGCDFVDPYTGLASFGDFAVNVTSSTWFIPSSPITYTCARASVPRQTTSSLYVDYIAGGQLSTMQYPIHTYTSSNGGLPRRGLGVVLAERKPNLYAWASEETPAGFIYKALLSNANFTDPGDSTSFAVPVALSQIAGLVVASILTVLFK